MQVLLVVMNTTFCWKIDTELWCEKAMIELLPCTATLVLASKHLQQMICLLAADAAT
jgi:hypothetical protein